MVASILQFRTTHGWPIHAEDVPAMAQPVITGRLAELHISGEFPRTSCFVQVDVRAFALRWAARKFISLHTVVHVSGCQRSESRQKRRGSISIALQGIILSKSREHITSGSQHSKSSEDVNVGNGPSKEVHVTFNSAGGVSRVITLHMTSESGAAGFAKGLQTLLKMFPSPGPALPAIGRWVVSCMAATSTRGATGYLAKSELQALLRCANTSTNPSVNGELAPPGKLVCALPNWMEAAAASAGHHKKLLDAQQVTALLLGLCTSSKELAEKYELYAAAAGQMLLADWLNFIRCEQLDHTQSGDEDSELGTEANSDNEDTELAKARSAFVAATSLGEKSQVGAALSLLQFSLQLLNPYNDAARPARQIASEVSGLSSGCDVNNEPFAHYWTACSHNSCAAVALELTLPALCDFAP
eukprot:6985917-Prymnesium_polylepis.1